MAFRLATHRLTALTRPSLVGVQSPIAAKYAASSTRSYVTKQVSQQPGSENLQELKENAKVSLWQQVDCPARLAVLMHFGLILG